jgi:hypothetical protein
MKKKILFLIVGCLRPGFIRHINSWGPIIRSLKNVEILYVLQDQINLIPESISAKNINDKIFIDDARQHVLYRLFGSSSEEIKIIENFCKKSDILPLDVPRLRQYSSPMDYSFLYETLPFLNEYKCHIMLLDNNLSHGSSVDKMYASWKEAQEYIISNNINFDYCVKIRPDYITVLSPDKFNDLLGYCIATNNIVLDSIWTQKDSVLRVGDQAAIGSYKNIMIYLNAETERENIRNGKTGSGNSHIMLRDYLRDFNITIANGRPFLKSDIVPWGLQRNRYFKDFLIENINRENYSEFLALLNQFSTSL